MYEGSDLRQEQVESAPFHFHCHTWRGAKTCHSLLPPAFYSACGCSNWALGQQARYVQRSLTRPWAGPRWRVHAPPEPASGDHYPPALVNRRPTDPCAHVGGSERASVRTSDPSAHVGAGKRDAPIEHCPRMSHRSGAGMHGGLRDATPHFLLLPSVHSPGSSQSPPPSSLT